MRRPEKPAVSVTAHGAFLRLPVFAVLVLLLLFSQSADLVHAHGDSLDRQFDCDICLKIGSSQEALPSQGTLPPRLESTAAFAPQADSPYLYTSIIQRSRAPPHA